MEVRTVDIHGQQWQIRLRGDELQIVDSLGRERHRSTTHAMSGVHLALLLDEYESFRSTTELDATLRRRAESFLSECTESHESAQQDAQD